MMKVSKFWTVGYLNNGKWNFITTKDKNYAIRKYSEWRIQCMGVSFGQDAQRHEAPLLQFRFTGPVPCGHQHLRPL
jgi:hypothetical protein